MFDGVEVERWICIASTMDVTVLTMILATIKRRDAPVAFRSRPSSSIMASRVAIRGFRTTLSLARQSKLSPPLSRSMVYVAPNSASKAEPKKSATAADLTAEDLDRLPSHKSTSTATSNGNGNGNRAATDNNGHSWAEGSGDGSPSDWSRSFHGLSMQPFDREISEILLAPVDPVDIEVKPGTPLYANSRTKAHP